MDERRRASKKTSTGSPSPTKKSRILLGPDSLCVSLSRTRFDAASEQPAAAFPVSWAHNVDISARPPLRLARVSSSHDETQGDLAQDTLATGTVPVPARVLRGSVVAVFVCVAGADL